MKTEGASIATHFNYCVCPPIKIKAYPARPKLISLVMKHMQRCTQREKPRDVGRRDAATAMGWDSRGILACVLWSHNKPVSECQCLAACRADSRELAVGLLGRQEQRSRAVRPDGMHDTILLWMNCVQGS